MYSYLDLHPRIVIRMHQRIEYGFAHGILRNRITLHTNQAIITDTSLKILEIYEFNNPVRLNKQGTVNFILILQIGTITKETNFHISTAKPSFRLTMKKQDRS